MFDKREVLTYKKVDPAKVTKQIVNYWTSSGFYVTQVSPNHFYGETGVEEMGFKPQFNLFTSTSGDTTTFDLTMTGKISEVGVVLVVILAFFLMPLAIILAVLAYIKFEERSKGYSYYFWAMLNQETKQTGAPPYSPPPPMYGQPPPPPPPPQGVPPPE